MERSFTGELAEKGIRANVISPWQMALSSTSIVKVESVFSDNFWFEIIQPLGNHDPWAAWLQEHGTSICSICLLSEGALEDDEQTIKNAGFESIFKHEKGYEAYEYFDTSKVLGVLVEMKEQYK